MATVLLDKVSKTYEDGRHAVHDLDLEIADGEFLVLVGPAGSGKSTALRMVAGLEDISAGTLRIGGRIVNELSPRERDIAMVFQSYALYPHMTVADNISYGLRIRGTEQAEVDRRVRRAADILELAPVLDRNPRQLSAIQRQRIALGRAIVREPQVFLMDDPLASLNAGLREQLRADITHVQDALKITTIYVTHDREEALTMGDRVALLHDGRLKEVGKPPDIVDNPGSVFAAGFLGSPPMNLARGRVSPDLESVTVGSAVLRLSAAELADYAGREVVIGIRPEHLTLAGRSAAGQSLRATVSAVQATLLQVTVAAEGVTIEEPPQPRYVPEPPPRPSGVRFAAQRPPTGQVSVGDEIELAVEVARLHFFDPNTGAAIRS
jgi:multiple sugar transport system ATP-binding protein